MKKIFFTFALVLGLLSAFVGLPLRFAVAQDDFIYGEPQPVH